MKRKVLKAVAYTFLILCFFFSFKVFADSITFSAQVGDTILIIKGYTSPNSLVTFIENNTVIGTIASDSTGYFEKNFTAQNDGLHEIEMHSTDIENTSTPVISKDITLIPFQTTEINDIVLPPTVTVNQTVFNSGDSIIISGYTKPNTQTQLILNGTVSDTISVMSDNNGYFIYQYPANGFINGDYRVQVFIKDVIGQVIGKSFETLFSISIPAPVNPPVVSPTAPPTTVSSPVTTPISVPVSKPVSSTTDIPVEGPISSEVGNSSKNQALLIFCLICTCSLAILLLLIFIIIFFRSDDDDEKKKKENQTNNIN